MDTPEPAASPPRPKKLRKVVDLRDPTDGETQKSADSALSQLNSRTIRKLKRKLKEDPEIDLLSILSPSYSTCRRQLSGPPSETAGAKTIDETDPITLAFLRSAQRAEELGAQSMLDPQTFDFELPPHLSRFRLDSELVVHSPLSPQVLGHLDLQSEQDPTTQDLLRALVKCEVVFEGISSGTTLILGLSEDVIVKASSEARSEREYAALMFVRDSCPDVAAPKPLGMISIGPGRLIFMSRFQGCTLQSMWPSLTETEKHSLTSDLDLLLSRLRAYTIPAGHPWGAVDGSGCIDRRRGLRQSHHIINDAAAFKEFYFSNPLYGSKLWTSILQDIYDSCDRKERNGVGPCVLTHGDLHPSNIIVQSGQESGTVDVVGLIDWEASGYYPHFWETLKLTNCLGPHEDLDWYRYLPSSVSLTRYSALWLLNVVWDGQVAGTSTSI